MANFVNPYGHVPVGTGQQVPTVNGSTSRGQPARQTGVNPVPVYINPMQSNVTNPYIIAAQNSRRPAPTEIHQGVGTDALVVTKKTTNLKDKITNTRNT